jgi:hypothetical protein
MDPYKASARFAAYVWFFNRKGRSAVNLDEAVRFAVSTPSPSCSRARRDGSSTPGSRAVAAAHGAPHGM